MKSWNFSTNMLDIFYYLFAKIFLSILVITLFRLPTLVLVSKRFLIKLKSKKSERAKSVKYDGCLIIDITAGFKCFLTLSIRPLLIIKIKILVLS